MKITIDTLTDNHLYKLYRDGKYWLSTSKTNSLTKIIAWLNNNGFNEIEIK